MSNDFCICDKCEWDDHMHCRHTDRCCWCECKTSIKQSSNNKYICPQCGPSPEGANEHARIAHTWKDDDE